jgi:hypothetical protein
VELCQGRSDEALGHLERMHNQARFDTVMWSPLHSRSFDRWLRAELLRAAGRAEESRRWYGSYGGNALYDTLFAAPAQIRLRAIHETAGRAEEAAASAARLRRLWGAADPAIAEWPEKRGV